MEFRVMVEPQQGATYEQQLRFALHAETCGFTGFFRSDHFLRIGPGDPAPGPTDLWVTLGALARETSQIRLGAMVSSATFRLPGVLAVQVAQIDAMSAGRLEVGLGSGWFEPEHASYGIPFPNAAERRRRWEEQLAVLTGIWRTPPGESFSYHGEFYSLVDCPCLPRPIQRPHPPLVIGGKGPRRTPAIAAKYADEYNIAFDSLESEAVQFARVRDACDAAGRPFDDIVYSVAVTTAVGFTDAGVNKRISGIGDNRERLDAGPGLVGTPAQVIDRVGTYAEMGVTRMYLQMKDIEDLDQLSFIATEIMSRSHEMS